MLFLRREPTNDSATLEAQKIEKSAGLKVIPRFDVVAYRSKNPVGRWPWHYSNCPNKRQRTVMLNCAKMSCKWLPDLK